MPFPKALPLTGYGLLGLTWRPDKLPDERCFGAMKAAIENGATVWSSSSIYGMPPEPPTAGLHLLRRFFEKYPEYADQVTLFIRACCDATTLAATNTREGVVASFAECNEILAPFKKIDVFGPARIDPNVPLEETIGTLKELMDRGDIGAVGLSEVRAETIRKASNICRISVVEVEFSLWSTEVLTNAVAAICKELEIPILTYSPLGYGFLTGKVRKLEDIPKGDIRLMFGRFQPEVKQMPFLDVHTWCHSGRRYKTDKNESLAAFLQEHRARGSGGRDSQGERGQPSSTRATVDPGSFESRSLRDHYSDPRCYSRRPCS